MMFTNTPVTVGATLFRVSRTLLPHETERLRSALRQMLAKEGSQSAVARSIKAKQQHISAVLSGKSSGGYALARAVAEAKSIREVDAWLSGRALTAEAPRLKNVEGYDAALIEAKRMFRRVPDHAFHAVGELMGESLPEHVDAIFLGTIAEAWARSADDNERSSAILHTAEAEMAAEDARKSKLSPTSRQKNTPHK